MFEGVPIAVHFNMVQNAGQESLGQLRNYTKCLDGCMPSTLKELKEDCLQRQEAARASGAPHVCPRTDCRHCPVASKVCQDSKIEGGTTRNQCCGNANPTNL